jgi:hypothetical protein
VKHRHASISARVERIEDIRRGAPAVDGEHAPAVRSAYCKYPRKNVKLVLPVAATRGGSIEPDLTDITRTRQKLLEEVKLAPPFVSQFGVEAQGRPDARRTARQRKGPAPGGWRCRHGEHVRTGLYTSSHNRIRVGIEIEVTMEVDHPTPHAL